MRFLLPVLLIVSFSSCTEAKGRRGSSSNEGSESSEVSFKATPVSDSSSSESDSSEEDLESSSSSSWESWEKAEDMRPGSSSGGSDSIESQFDFGGYGEGRDYHGHGHHGHKRMRGRGRGRGHKKHERKISGRGMGNFGKATADQPIIYHLFTQKNKLTGQIIDTAGGVNGTNWDKNEKVVVIIHPFLGDNSSEKTLGQLVIKNAYLKAGSRDNIIVADWTALAQATKFVKSVAATRKAGADLATLLFNLLQDKQIQIAADIHLIGFSLGAHVAGVAGHVFENYTQGERFGRITGLDPARVIFDEFLKYKIPFDHRFVLDKRDANFVDILHCNIGSKPIKLGLIARAGHADFYPNGGKSQPGCPLLEDSVCSNSRCWELFSVSVAQSQAFPACRCDDFDVLYTQSKCLPCDKTNDTVFMGDSCSPRTRGIYWLEAEVKPEQLDIKIEEESG